MIPTVAITVALNDQNGDPIADAPVIARLTDTEVYQGYVVPQEVAAQTNNQGIAVLDLFPNALGSTATRYEFRLVNPNSGKSITVMATVPNFDTSLHLIADLPAFEGKTDGQLAVEEAIAVVGPVLVARDQAQAAAMQAQQTLENTLPQVQAAAAAAAASAAAALQSAVSAASSEQIVVTQSSTVTLATSLTRSQAIFLQALPDYQNDFADTELAAAVDAAQTAATNAQIQAGAAAILASDAETSADSAAASATSASASATTATTGATTATTAATNAAASAVSADTSADAALVSQNAAAASATAADASADAAAADAADVLAAASVLVPAIAEFNQINLGNATADPTLDNNGDALIAGAMYFNTTTQKQRIYTGDPLAWEDEDADLSAAIAAAASSAASADTSEANALNYKDAALAAQTSAEGFSTAADASASNASSSATAAANSATTAAESATEASDSAASSANSATAAATSATAAALSATNAGTSATAAIAAQEAAELALSDTNDAKLAAETAEDNASTSATAAASSATAAAASATSASSSASNAATAASNALTSAAQAAQSFDNFNDLYLGPFPDAPTTDNDGNELIVGALYFDSVLDKMQVWRSDLTWGDLPGGGGGGSSDPNAVKLTGDQTVAGIKNFSDSPLVPTVTKTDASTKAASTAFVRSQGYVLNQNGVKVNGTPSQTTEEVLATITVPANSMGPNGSILLLVRWSYTESANSKTFRVRFGGTTLWAATTSTATNEVYQALILIQNRGATNSQVGSSSFGFGLSTSGDPLNVSAIDTTADVALTITGQRAVGTDVINLESRFIQLFPGA